MERMIRTTYTSRTVTLPEGFLTRPAPDSQAPTAQRIEFSTSPLPEYAAAHAIVIENALSPSECQTLLRLAEISAGADPSSIDASAPGTRDECWKPALVNGGPGVEFLMTDYRNSDRIIWDHSEMVARLWARCLEANGVGEALAGVGGQRGAGTPESVLGKGAAQRGQRWRFTRLNQRMRFLRYGAGGFFRAHCDGSYTNPEKLNERSLYTLHLYLNSGDSSEDSGNIDTPSESALKEPLKGGATTFYEPDAWHDELSPKVRRMNIDPKMGRILIFQHRRLLHAGEEVQAGLKFTLRTDLMFERLEDEAVQED